MIDKIIYLLFLLPIFWVMSYNMANKYKATVPIKIFWMSVFWVGAGMFGLVIALFIILWKIGLLNFGA